MNISHALKEFSGVLAHCLEHLHHLWVVALLLHEGLELLKQVIVYVELGRVEVSTLSFALLAHVLHDFVHDIIHFLSCCKLLLNELIEFGIKFSALDSFLKHLEFWVIKEEILEVLI